MADKTDFIVLRAEDFMLVSLAVSPQNANPGWYSLSILKGDKDDESKATRRIVRLHKDEILKMAEFVKGRP